LRATATDEGKCGTDFRGDTTLGQLSLKKGDVVVVKKGKVRTARARVLAAEF
jgi:hypothetical protein